MTDDIQKILEEKLEDIVEQKVVEHFREDSFKVIIGQLTESVVAKTIKQRFLWKPPKPFLLGFPFLRV